MVWCCDPLEHFHNGETEEVTADESKDKLESKDQPSKSRKSDRSIVELTVASVASLDHPDSIVSGKLFLPCRTLRSALCRTIISSYRFIAIAIAQ